MALALVSEGWAWQCSCGASGVEKEREAAREAFKQHRKNCVAKNPIQESVMSTTAAKNASPKKAAKKASGKAPTAKKEGKKRTPGVTEAQAKTVLDRLQSGKTTLLAESKKLGFTHNGPLRAALRDMMGEKEYGKFMEERGKPREGAEPKAAKKAPAKKAAAPAKKAAAPAKKAAKKAPAKKKPSAPKAQSDDAPGTLEHSAPPVIELPIDTTEQQ